MITGGIKSMICLMQLLVKPFLAGAAILISVFMLSAGAGAQTPFPSAPASAPVTKPKLSPLASPPVWRKLEALSGTLTLPEFDSAMRNIYSDSSPFTPPWQVGADAVSVNTDDPLRPVVKIAFRPPVQKPAEIPRFWRTATELPLLSGRPPLSDVHIAIDPGHIGGAYAKTEERFLSFNAGEAVQEGDLTLLTAQVLKTRLEELGAVASLVRDKNEPVTPTRPAELNGVALEILKDAGVPAPVERYDGLTGDAKILTVQWQSEKLFYRVSEIRARAKKVNEQLKPDLVLCLHLNAEEWGDAEQPKFSPVNHMHVIVNGCYSPIELKDEDVRFEMFTRLFSRMHEAELPVAEAVADGLAKVTGLPPYVYTTKNARRAGTSPYVYARNLLANRLYECPVVYLEPFVMNHQETYQRLLVGHFRGRTLINGRLQTSAIEDYVRGVVDGLVKHYTSKRPG
jgi:N-acetylmuramoyl-L-alanine amidase